MRAGAAPSVVVYGSTYLPGLGRRLSDRLAPAPVLEFPAGASVDVVADADVLITEPSRSLESLFAAARRLRWIHCTSTGVDRFLFPALVESDVLLTSSKGTSTDAVATHALALLLGLWRGLPAAESQRRERRWAQIAGDEPTGKTLGVLGFGLVGQRVARGARALEMTVIGADIVAPPRDAPCDRFVDTASGLPETLLAEIDALVITAALTPATRGLVDARALGRMKPSAVVVNVSRGPIINESDLVAALLAGGIAGAGLDVASPEPPHRDSPLWTLPNVILTPHMAWSSPMVEQRVAELIVANYRRLGAGQPLLNLVDKRAVE